MPNLPGEQGVVALAQATDQKVVLILILVLVIGFIVLSWMTLSIRRDRGRAVSASSKASNDLNMRLLDLVSAFNNSLGNLKQSQDANTAVDVERIKQDGQRDRVLDQVSQRVAGVQSFAAVQFDLSSSERTRLAQGHTHQFEVGFETLRKMSAELIASLGVLPQMSKDLSAVSTGMDSLLASVDGVGDRLSSVDNRLKNARLEDIGPLLERVNLSIADLVGLRAQIVGLSQTAKPELDLERSN